MKISKIIMPNYLGIASASLCIVHCIATPFLIVLFAGFEWWESFSYLFLILSFYSAFEASNHSNNSKVLLLIWGSFIIIAISILFEADYEVLELGSYIGGIGLIIGHILNIKNCKNCTND